MPYSADDIRRLLGQNEALMRKTDAQSVEIRRSAADELDRVNSRLAEMQPGQVARDPVLAAKYQELVADRGRLSLLALS